jgi:hypothetical protein
MSNKRNPSKVKKRLPFQFPSQLPRRKEQRNREHPKGLNNKLSTMCNLLWVLFLDFQIDDYVEIENWIEKRIVIVTSQFLLFWFFFRIQGGADCLWSLIYFLDYRRFFETLFSNFVKKLNLFEFICFHKRFDRVSFKDPQFSSGMGSIPPIKI